MLHIESNGWYLIILRTRSASSILVPRYPLLTSNKFKYHCLSNLENENARREAIYFKAVAAG
jgi:hypothetical protein